MLTVRGGLIFKAHRLLYHSTQVFRVIKKRRECSRSRGESFDAAVGGERRPLRGTNSAHCGFKRATSLIGKRHPIRPYTRPMPWALWWSWGGGAFYYERGTPVFSNPAFDRTPSSTNSKPSTLNPEFQTLILNPKFITLQSNCLPSALRLSGWKGRAQA